MLDEHDQKTIRCVLQRGGTSKGLYFHNEDLPVAGKKRDRLLQRLMGSPDVVQIDGLGGSRAITSKIAIVSPSQRHDADVDYVTAAAWLDGKVDWKSYDKLHDPDLLKVTGNMIVNVNDDLPDGGAIVTVDGVDGASLRVDVATGDPTNWMGDDALRRKFMNETVDVYGVERATEIFEALLALGNDDSVSRLVKMTRLHGERTG